MTALGTPAFRWLRTGQEFFPTMLQAIGTAQKSIQLETYIYTDGQIGRLFLEALLAVARRGVRVRLLVDAVGSWFLPDAFFNPLVAVGGEVHRFNPLHLWRFGVRDHRNPIHRCMNGLPTRSSMKIPFAPLPDCFYDRSKPPPAPRSAWEMPLP